MYVHIGQDYMIPARSIVAIFDMDTATASPRTRRTLGRLEQEGRVVSVFDDLPRAGILCQTALGEMLYLTGLSPAALSRRVQAGLRALQTIDGKGT